MDITGDSNDTDNMQIDSCHFHFILQIFQRLFCIIYNMLIARTYHESIEQNDVAIEGSKYIYTHI